MAEIWNLEIGADTLDDKVKHELPFVECIDLLELLPDEWSSDTETIPDVKTGDPFVDSSGYICVCVRVFQDEVDSVGDKGWKPGWYKSKVTVIGLLDKLRSNAK